MKKTKLTEEFLWKLYQLSERTETARRKTVPRTAREAFPTAADELRHEYERAHRKKSFAEFISYLRGQGYVKIPKGQSISEIQLTQKGQEKAMLATGKRNAFPDRTDGKMIMLMYDIPKEKYRTRRPFRGALEFLGYHFFQKSVWITEKDVLKETEDAIRKYKLSPYVNLFIIEKIYFKPPLKSAKM